LQWVLQILARHRNTRHMCADNALRRQRESVYASLNVVPVTHHRIIDVFHPVYVLIRLTKRYNSTQFRGRSSSAHDASRHTRHRFFVAETPVSVSGPCVIINSKPMLGKARSWNQSELDPTSCRRPFFTHQAVRAHLMLRTYGHISAACAPCPLPDCLDGLA
jgi:hypothetical protein